MARNPAAIPPALDPAREAEEYGALTPEQRAYLLVAACRAGAKLLRSLPDPERIAAYVDPLPESSVRALARLRDEYRAARQASNR